MIPPLLAALAWWRGGHAPRGDDRGDVPGWVLITLMTVGIVMALWLIAEPALSGLIRNALNISGDPNGGS